MQKELKLEKYPLLRGKTFQLKVGHGRGEHLIEVMPTPAAHASQAEGRP